MKNHQFPSGVLVFAVLVAAAGCDGNKSTAPAPILNDY